MMEFFKANEKVIMVMLLVIIAPSFAFTTLMFSNIGNSSQDTDYLEMYGETFKVSDIQQLSLRVADVNKIALLMFRGVPGRPRIGEEDVIQHYIFLREAKERGIAVSDQELGEVVTELGKSLIALHQVRNEEQVFADDGAFFQALNQKRDTVRFNHAEYQAALRNEKVGLQMSVKRFEGLVREWLTKTKLLSVPGNTVVVSEKEIYEEFEEELHKRTFEFVRVSAADFIEEAKSKITPEELEERWNRTPVPGKEFERKPSLKLEIAMVGSQPYQPTDEELLAYYEKNKDTRYRMKVQPAADPEKEGGEGQEGQDEPKEPEVRYKPFDAVRSQVLSAVKVIRLKEIAEAARTEAAKLQGEGKEFDLLDVFGEHAVLAEKFETGWFDVDGVNDLPASYKNVPILRSLFSAAKFPELQEGSVGDRTVATRQGAQQFHYVYRIAGKRDAEVPAGLADVEEEVRDAVAQEKATQLAKEFLDGWATELSENPEATFQRLAADKNYKVHTTEPVGRSDSRLVKIDDKIVDGAFFMLRAGFDIDEVGGVGQAVEYRNPITKETDVFQVTLTGTAPPDTTTYETRRSAYESRVRARKQEAALSLFQQKLFDRAQVARLNQQPEEEVEGEG